jgi:hypothetical protein
MTEPALHNPNRNVAKLAFKKPQIAKLRAPKAARVTHNSAQIPNSTGCVP